jgi:hypothetical protein
MKTFTLILTSCIALFILYGCSSSTESNAKADGTITVQLTGAAEANGKNAFFSVFQSDVNLDSLGTMTQVELMEKVEGAGYFTIANGTGESGTFDINTFQPKIFKGGDQFIVILFVDINESVDLNDPDPIGMEPKEGDRFSAEPKSVTIDGNTEVVYKYEELIVWQESQQ